jgi:hypothetical protein
MTPCMPCSFGLLRFRWSGAGAPVQRPPRSDRDCPVDTDGDRCLWHAGGAAVRTMWLAPGGEGSPLAGQVRLVPGDDGLVGKPGSGAAASGRPGITVGRVACSAALGGAHATTTSVPITRAPGRPALPGACLPSAVQQALIGIPFPTRQDPLNQYTVDTFLYHYSHGLSKTPRLKDERD